MSSFSRRPSGRIVTIRVADISGRIADISESSIAELGLEQLQGKTVFLDFQSVDFLSSRSLGTLIKFYKRCKGLRIPLKLCNLRKEIMEIFKITNLDRIFEIVGQRPPEPPDSPPTHGEVYAKLKPRPSGGMAQCNPAPEEE
jgi:anti-sigma B factor antagonist